MPLTFEAKLIEGLPENATAFHLLGKMIPAPRPRFNRKLGRAYYPTQYKEWLIHATRALSHLPMPITAHKDPVMVALHVTRVRSHLTKLLFPSGDVDNFAKGVLDAMTDSEKFWADDRQVTRLYATKELVDPPEREGAVVLVLRSGDEEEFLEYVTDGVDYRR